MHVPSYGLSFATRLEQRVPRKEVRPPLTIRIRAEQSPRRRSSSECCRLPWAMPRPTFGAPRGSRPLGEKRTTSSLTDFLLSVGAVRATCHRLYLPHVDARLSLVPTAPSTPRSSASAPRASRCASTRSRRRRSAIWAHVLTIVRAAPGAAAGAAGGSGRSLACSLSAAPRSPRRSSSRRPAPRPAAAL